MLMDLAKAAAERLRRRDADEDGSQQAQVRAAATDAPYVRAVGVYEGVARWVTRAGLVALLGSAGLHACQQRRIHGLAEALRAKDFLVVPGASDFVEVRANLIPDRVVVAFAEYFASQIATVSERTIQGRHDALAHLMSPALEARLEQELSTKAAILREVKGAEVFDQLGTPEIRRVTMHGRPMFEAKVRGRIERYALGRALEASVEVITLRFGTRQHLGPEEPWVFEVAEIERRTEAEQLEYDRSVRMAGGAP